jgi:hypothetical protein
VREQQRTTLVLAASLWVIALAAPADDGDDGRRAIWILSALACSVAMALVYWRGPR